MKLKKKLLGDRPAMKDKPTNNSSGKSSSSSAPSWALTRPEEQREAVQSQKTLNGGNRPPEVFFKDGESKMLRFRHEGPIACIYAYSLKINGKWRRFTAPRQGDVDLFRDELELSPSLKAVYEVIDIDGFTTREGKTFKNVSRFLVASGRVYEQLEKLRQKKGPLCDYDIEVTRSGESTNTTYMFLPEERSPMTSDMKKAEDLKSQFEKYFAPLTEEEQRGIVKQCSRRTD